MKLAIFAVIAVVGVIGVALEVIRWREGESCGETLREHERREWRRGYRPDAPRWDWNRPVEW